MEAAGGVVRVLVLTDNTLIGEGLCCLGSHEAGLEMIGYLGFETDVLGAADRLTPNVVIICPWMPIFDPRVRERLRRLRARASTLGVVVVSDFGDDLGLELVHWKMHGMAYLLYEQPALVNAIFGVVRQVAAGNSISDTGFLEWSSRQGLGKIGALTARERDVLAKLSHAASNRAIASEMCISIKAVEKHVTSIFRKLGLTFDWGLDRRVAAARLWADMEHPLSGAPYTALHDQYPERVGSSN